LLVPERGGELIDAAGRRVVGTKGKYPHCAVFVPLPVATFPRPDAVGSALEKPSTDMISRLNPRHRLMPDADGLAGARLNPQPVEFVD